MYSGLKSMQKQCEETVLVCGNTCTLLMYMCFIFCCRNVGGSLACCHGSHLHVCQRPSASLLCGQYRKMMSYGYWPSAISPHRLCSDPLDTSHDLP